MTCVEAKKISLVSVLEKIGAKKIKHNNREIWYLSPFRNESTGSFKIDLVKNIWYDHGEGIGGNVLDFVMRYYKCDLKEALQILDKESFSFHQPFFKVNAIEKESNYEIKSVESITNFQLIDYMQSRFVSQSVLKKYCVEIQYKMNSKFYYGIGFKNDSSGYEIRNKYFKGCLGKKDITQLKNDKIQVIIFEGWIDFLSLIILYPSIELAFDFIILNSVSLKEKVENLKRNYEQIYLCFDNDDAGNLITLFFQNKFENRAIDTRYFYEKFKDLNEYLVHKMTII